MSYRSLGAAISCSLILSSFPVLAQQVPEACRSMSDPPPSVLSPFPPVVFDKPQIVHKDDSYYIELFSATAPKPGERFDQCFRYEAEDVTAPVNSFYWPIAGDWWRDKMAKGERYEKLVVRPVNTPPQVIKNTVYAFEKDPATTRAWASVVAPKAASSSPTAAFETILPGADLAAFLASHRLPIRPLIAFNLKEWAKTRHPLRTPIQTPRSK